MKKIILITGASAGMGKEMARHLAQDGHIVYGAARRVEKMADLKQFGVRVLAMDVTDEVSMIAGVETIVKAEGGIDVLINNAGFGSYGAIEDVPIADARYQMEVNVFGAAHLTQLVLPHMRKQGSGTIINISSVGGKFAMALGGWYHASKFALEALSDSLRNEVKRFGIDVVVIEPGGVKSEWGSIAMDNLLKISGNTPYSPLAQKFSDSVIKISEKNAEPIVIVDLVRKAIAAKQPKTRYHGGYMAGLILFMRKILSDRTFDKILLAQLK
ncbi:NADP-dependent 3-hydroxy acid dehydrogenase YdfG [Mucilaginibacter sp. OK268]|uniref:oxidoreductase n=1 Tax=Mucilaginibacter sp. OK268 TaxID=1881048 RepID=UPI0008833323|nr:oxidoreductase [Mucilaginibacter sp. OK268]SDP23079.1 NADP-dependent 3-hydroxy acid dehydrogenase YdfG [Mucilaginibacter sp. OK268]